MATSLSVTKCRVDLGWTYSSTNSFGTDSTNSASFGYTQTLSDGTGAGKAQKIFINKTTIAASSSTSLDLAGSLSDLYGNTITFARVKILYFELLTDTTASSVSVGGAATNGLANWITSADTLDNDTPAVRVRNGGVFFLACTDATAYAVTAGTGDILKLTNNDGSNVATYKIVIIGE